MKKISFKILNYVVTTSALTFIMVRVILEMRSALEKDKTIKDVTGGASSSSPSVSGLTVLCLL